MWLFFADSQCCEIVNNVNAFVMIKSSSFSKSDQDAMHAIK